MARPYIAVGDVGRVPEHDRGDEVEAGGTKLLAPRHCVGKSGLVCRPCLPALFEGADDLREEMTLLALAEPGMAAPTQFQAFDPVEHEQGAFDPPQLPECEIDLVLVADMLVCFSAPTPRLTARLHLHAKEATSMTIDVATGIVRILKQEGVGWVST